MTRCCACAAGWSCSRATTTTATRPRCSRAATPTSCTRGPRVLGGCSSHNTQIWFKPLPLRLAGLGRPGRDGLGLRADGRVPRPHPGAARDRRRAGPQPVPARLDPGRLGRRRRAREPGLERRAVLRWRRLPRRRLRPGDRHPLVVERDVPAPDHGRPRQPLDPVRVARAAAGRQERPRDGRARGARGRRPRPDRGRGARSSSPAGRSTRRGCCCSRASARGATWSGSASSRCTTCPGSART